ncbi:MAG: hypothetical protein ACRDNZ_02555 [Streptosporangiaceae bacterium]
MTYPGAPPARGSGPGKRRRGVLISIAAGVAVIVLAAIVIPLALGGGDSPTTMALKSGQAIGVADGIAFTGSIAGKPATLSVTRAGTVEGSYTAGGSQISRVTIQGVTYLKAPTEFWMADGVGAAEARQAGGHWARAPADTASISFAALTPVQIARTLKSAGPNPQSVSGTFRGTKVVVLTAGGTSYYITAGVPHRLIHVTGGSGPEAYSFDVQPLTAASVKPVFTALVSEVHALYGAADPEAIVNGGTPQFLDCGSAVRCTVNSSVTLSDPAAPANLGSGPVLVRMTVGFAGLQNGKPFTTCSVTVAVTPSSAVKPTCGVSGAIWSNWFNSHSGHFSVWADAAYAVTVNPPRVIAALETDLSQEQGAS